MSSNSEIGWAPSARVQRQVALPDQLDDELATLASEWRSTPAALIADALFDARERGWTTPVPSEYEFEPGPTRTIALDPQLVEEIESRLAEISSHGGDADLSYLVSAFALFYLRHRLGRSQGGEPQSGTSA